MVESIHSQKFNGHDAGESADFVEFLGLAGLGKAEAAALRQSDIDWQREKITTFRHKTKSGFAIPIYPQLKPLLLRRRRDGGPNERVFAIDNAKKAIAIRGDPLHYANNSSAPCRTAAAPFGPADGGAGD